MKTKNSKKETAAKTTTRKRTARENMSDVMALSAEQVTANDFKNALLIVSVCINLFVLITWLVMQMTDRYNAAMILFMLR